MWKCNGSNRGVPLSRIAQLEITVSWATNFLKVQKSQNQVLMQPGQHHECVWKCKKDQSKRGKQAHCVHAFLSSFFLLRFGPTSRSSCGLKHCQLTVRFSLHQPGNLAGTASLLDIWDEHFSSLAKCFCPKMQSIPWWRNWLNCCKDKPMT